MTTIACGQCGAELSVDGVRTATCPYCASPNVVERPGAEDRPTAAFVVTFTGNASFAQRALDRWLGSRTLFADSALRHARVENLRGVYVPAYAYSAVATTHYTATIGEDYTETETYTDSDGKSQTRSVTRTEHRPLAGEHVGYVTDVVVSASTGLSNDELEQLEPFDLRQTRRYSPALVAGWIAEEFSRSAADCEQLARGETSTLIGKQLHDFMPGDSHRDLVMQTTVTWETLDPIYVPVWMFALRYRADKPALRVAINGQTGKIHGDVPLAWWKIALAIAFGVAIAVALYLLVLAAK